MRIAPVAFDCLAHHRSGRDALNPPPSVAVADAVRLVQFADGGWAMSEPGGTWRGIYPRLELLWDADSAPPPRAVAGAPARTVKLHPSAVLPDGAPPWMSDGWQVIAPDAAPVASLPESAIESRHLMSLFWEVVPPTLPDAERIARAERWLGCSLASYIDRDRAGNIISVKRAIRRLDDHTFVRRAARRRWRQDRSLRMMRNYPLGTDYATSVDLSMYRAAAVRWDIYRQTVVIRSSDGSILDLPTPEQCNRRNYAKLIAQGRGWATFANEAGKEARLVTITLPPAYHPTTTAGDGKRRPNETYSGISPREAHETLHRQFRLFCRDLGGGRGHLDIDFDFMRAVQPHLDGCPHWHLVIFGSPSDWPAIIERLRRRFVDEIADVTGATTKRRIKIDRIKGGVGGALAYVSRALAYITRAVEGAKDAAEAERTAAWASTWGIRRYEFSGSSFSTLWRMMGRREFADTKAPELVDAVAARRLPKGDFRAFSMAVRREGLTPLYLPSQNQYGEPTQKLAGIRADDVVWLITPWERIPRPAQAAQDGASASPLVRSLQQLRAESR